MAWYSEWFDTPYYHILYSNRDYQEAEYFLSKLMNVLQLPQQSFLIDLACGKGRHSVYLHKMGYKVLGLDLSENSIMHNRSFENEGLQFEVHDMRAPMKHKNVDAVLNLFTSFGYFDDEKDDAKVFASVAEALSTNGVFVLDFLNASFVHKTLCKEEKIIRGDLIFNIRRRIESAHIIKDIDFSDEGKNYHFFEKVKLHTKHEIENLASQFGLQVKQAFGDYHLNAFDEEKSPRCILIFYKQ